MPDPIEVVRGFCDGMVRRDPDARRGHLAGDVVDRNTGMPAKHGVDDVLADLAGRFSLFPDSYEDRMRNIAADGGVVQTERVEMIKGCDGRLHGVPD